MRRRKSGLGTGRGQREAGSQGWERAGTMDGRSQG